VILGAVLLLATAKGWRARPAPGSAPEMPGWTRTIDQMSPRGALGFAVLLSLNPGSGTSSGMRSTRSSRACGPSASATATARLSSRTGESVSRASSDGHPRDEPRSPESTPPRGEFSPASAPVQCPDGLGEPAR
jgi:hypothetical protein